MDAARLVENEVIQFISSNYEERSETYLIRWLSGSGVYCLNGTAARKGLPGDRVVIVSYGVIPISDMACWAQLIYPQREITDWKIIQEQSKFSKHGWF